MGFANTSSNIHINYYGKFLFTLKILHSFQAYIIYIKKIHPRLTDETNKILSSYYQLQRRTLSRNKARTTVRLLDSLVR